MVCGIHIHVNLENVDYEGKEVLVSVDLLGGGRGITITKMCQIRAIAKNKTDIEYIFMTLTFRPKTITKSKTCNGDEWRRRRAIKGKCPNFLKGRLLSLETSVASSETVIAPFDKKNQFGTLAFSHNSNFKFWLVGERFMQTRGHKASEFRLL